jgi:hypothetical protein
MVAEKPAETKKPALPAGGGMEDWG